MPRPQPPNLRSATPTIEPDDIFLARLTELAAASTAAASTPPRLVSHLRIGLAAAGVVAIAGGGAWLSSQLDGVDSPAPPTSPSAPLPSDVDPTTDPTTAPPDAGDTAPTPTEGVPLPGNQPGNGAVDPDPSTSTGATGQPDAGPGQPTAGPGQGNVPGGGPDGDHGQAGDHGQPGDHGEPSEPGEPGEPRDDPGPGDAQGEASAHVPPHALVGP